jgi:hypothetical protein
MFAALCTQQRCARLAPDFAQRFSEAERAKQARHARAVPQKDRAGRGSFLLA